MAGGLRGKMVSQMEIKCDADAFYDLFSKRPYDLPALTPSDIPSSVLREGQWGTVGSIVSPNYLYDGKSTVAVKKIKAIDLEKKSMINRVIEGDLMEQFQSFAKTLHVEGNLVTWTIEYEKKAESVPDPDAFMDFTLKITRDVDAKLASK